MYRYTSEFLAAIKYLPVGGTLIVPDVSWADYDQLLTALGEGYAVRISFHQDKLIISRSTSRHEMFKELVSMIAWAVADKMQYDLESCGSTTLRLQRLNGGVEPDGCFYVQNVDRIIGVDDLDLNVTPPPDVVVEIDVSHDSEHKLAIYADLNVPELWRYDGELARMYKLVDGHYVEIANSVALPILKSEMLTRVLEQSKTEGQTGSLPILYSWLQDQ